MFPSHTGKQAVTTKGVSPWKRFPWIWESREGFLEEVALPGRGSTLSRGKGRDHCANVDTHQGIDMVVATMAIPSKR